MVLKTISSTATVGKTIEVTQEVSAGAKVMISLRMEELSYYRIGRSEIGGDADQHYH